MSGKKRGNFLIGLIIGAAICVVIWYWQKSTSADDATFDLLDELARVRARLRELSDQAVAPAGPAQATPAPVAEATAPARPEPAKKPAAVAPAAADDDLTVIKGIGPVYAARLHEAGIRTFAAVARQEPEKLAQIVGLRNWQGGRPETWIAAARELADSAL